MSEINNRKIDHINIIMEDPECDRQGSYFDNIRLKHRALPEISLAEVDTSTEFLGKRLSFPLIISSMTGGEDSRLHLINKNLALAAEATQVGLAVGSQRIAIENQQAQESFVLRKYAPKALLISNLGAVQLNYSYGTRQCQQAVDMLTADALYLHLNPLQEAIQPEGDTNFAKLSDKIRQVNSELKVPLIIKEIGSGISEADAEVLIKAGVKFIDVAGSGGTSWSRVENFRRTQTDGLGIAFQDWGIPTPHALRALQKFQDKIQLISSGGVRNGIDMLKSVILGAQVCGVAAPFLKPASESAEEVIKVIERLKREFRLAMFLCGLKNIEKARNNSDLFLYY